MLETLIKQKLHFYNTLRFAGVDSQKEKEIVVWVRLQAGHDKPELIQFIQDKFHLDPQYAESLYYKAYPNGLSQEELSHLDELSYYLDSKKITPVELDSICDEVIIHQLHTPSIQDIPFIDLLISYLIDL